MAHLHGVLGLPNLCRHVSLRRDQAPKLKDHPMPVHVYRRDYDVYVDCIFLA